MPKICRFEGDGRNKPCNTDYSGDKAASHGLCGRCYRREHRKGNIGKYKTNGPTITQRVDQFLLDEIDRADVQVTVRYLYYRAVSEGVLPKDAGSETSEHKPSYSRIVRRAKELRQDGKISWDAIVDETRSAHEVDHFDNRDVTAEDVMINRLRSKTSYYASPWYGKKTVCELWVESRSFSQTIAPTCDALYVDLVPMGGQVSWSHVYNQVNKIYAREKPTHIYAFTDFDYAGFLIANAYWKAIQFFDKDNIITFERIGLTEQQIAEHNLSTIEPNAKQRKYAPDMKIACDLEAMHIDDMSALVKGYLNEYITQEDVDAARQARRDCRRQEQAIANRLIEVVKDEFLE